MAQDPKTPGEISMPDSLRKQLDAFRQSLWRTKITEALLAGLFGLIFSFVIVFALDRVWQTPGLLRLAILLCGTSLAAIFAPLWLHRWVWRHRRESELARLISKRFPGLGDRLLGVVELQNQVEDDDTLSPRLRAAAMVRVAEEAEKRQLEGALPASRQGRWTFAVLAVAAIAIGAFVFAPKAGLSSLKRWLMPLSSAQRYTFTKLEDVPEKLLIPQGEAFSLSLKLADDSEWRPATGSARYARQDEQTSELAENRYEFNFPAQQDPGMLRIEIGDARHNVFVTPTLRPAIRRVFAKVLHPEYLRLTDREVDLGAGVLSVVQGSQVSISADATRSLASATYGPLTNEGNTLAEGGDMEISSTTASTPSLLVPEQGFTVPISWTDELGLTGLAGFNVRIEALLDEAPSVYIQGIPRQHVMLADETVDFEILSEDDFGLRQIGLEWSGEFSRATDETPASGELKLLDGDPTTSRLSAPAAFSPATFNIQPQKLTLRAWAEDYLPDRGRAYSQPITLYVLTHDEHAQMLKTRFDRAISELEDLARKERNLYEENQRLEKLDPEALQSDEARQKLEAQQEAERQQTELMEDLAKKMQELFKDSARNGTIDPETLKKMAEAMQSMKELSEKDMPEVQEKLEGAQNQKSTEEKAKKDLEEGVEKQKDVLEKMQETVDKANDANERFEASTFVNRLKKAASEEAGVSMSSWDLFSRTGGSLVPELDPSDLRKVEETVRQQSNTASDVRWIQEDLGHFFARTNKEGYKELLDAMAESNIDLGLQDLTRTLDKNQGYLAKEAADQWAAKLQEWAKMLQDEQQNAGGGAGSGGSPPPKDEDFEFMLRVMKMIQQEQDIRARTRSLEMLRRTFEGDPNSKP